MSSNVMPMDQHSEKLVAAIHRWVRMLNAAERSVDQSLFNQMFSLPTYGPMREDVDNVGNFRHWNYSVIVGVHMVTISFGQLEEHTKHLAKTSLWHGDVARKGESFRSEVSRFGIGDLRDVLEHSADYIVGCGWKPHLAPDRSADFPGYGGAKGRLDMIEVFGRKYQIQDAMRAAREFAATLPNAPVI